MLLLLSFCGVFIISIPKLFSCKSQLMYSGVRCRRTPPPPFSADPSEHWQSLEIVINPAGSIACLPGRVGQGRYTAIHRRVKLSFGFFRKCWDKPLKGRIAWDLAFSLNIVLRDHHHFHPLSLSSSSTSRNSSTCLHPRCFTFSNFAMILQDFHIHFKK